MTKNHIFTFIAAIVVIGGAIAGISYITQDQNMVTDTESVTVTETSSQNTQNNAVATNTAQMSYTADTSKSTVTWEGSKKVVNDVQKGTLKIKSGTVVVTTDGTTITNASGAFSFDMNSIAGGEGVTKHLKSADFFDVATYPESTFVFDRVTSNGSSVSLLGTLTIKGKTQPIAVDGVTLVPNTDGTVTMRGNATFDRSKFDIKFGSESFFANLGDKAINDLVKVGFTVVLTQSKPVLN